MVKVKVVLDTNVLLSMLMKKTLAREFSKLIEEGKVELYSSEDILKELAKVLTYPKIEKIFEEVGLDKKLALEAIVVKLKIVKPTIKIDVITQDPADNKILECAIESESEYIVSGDKHLLQLRKLKNSQIISAREFLDKIS